jgi:hypothetical protein
MLPRRVEVDDFWGVSDGGKCRIELDGKADVYIRLLRVHREPPKSPGMWVTVVPEVWAEEVAATE